MNRLIYLDNAATTFPKPIQVTDTVRKAMTHIGGNPGRGSHRLSQEAGELIFDTRIQAAEMFGASSENVVFTSNATQALNYAIKGLASKGCHILLDNLSHNAVYRPVIALARENICTYDIYDSRGNSNDVLNSIRQKLRHNTTIIIATHQSNISSKVLPIMEIGHFCKSHGIFFIVDASQSAGHIPINFKQDSISALCLPGHKGLFGPMGVGMLISSGDVKFKTIIEGGAGISSLDAVMPDELPERLEAGTLPLPAIAGLSAGIKWVKEIGEEKIHSYESMLTSIFVREAQHLHRVVIHGDTGGSVVSFTVEGLLPSQVGEHLSSRGICVRTGYHCAPLAHKAVGTHENGSVRIGVSYMNRPSDIYALLEVLKELNSKM